MHFRRRRQVVDDQRRALRHLVVEGLEHPEDAQQGHDHDTDRDHYANETCICHNTLSLVKT
jgi:hypothetical protein